MTVYIAWDQFVEQSFEAETYKEALVDAKKWYADGDWGDSDETCWLEFLFAKATESGEQPEEYDTITITLDPKVPICRDSEEEHDFTSPFKIVGGIKENPGVWGHGGGIVCNEVCLKCGCKKTTDTWAQNPNNGEQGLTSIQYTPEFYDVGDPQRKNS